MKASFNWKCEKCGANVKASEEHKECLNCAINRRVVGIVVLIVVKKQNILKIE